MVVDQLETVGPFVRFCGSHVELQAVCEAFPLDSCSLGSLWEDGKAQIIHCSPNGIFQTGRDCNALICL